MAFAFPPPPSRKPPSPLAHPRAAVMDRLGSGILLDPTTGTGPRRAGGVRVWRRKLGGGQDGGEIIFFHLGGRRGGERRREAGGGGGRKSREGAACARRLIRCPSPAPPGGAGGLGEGRQDGGGEVGRAGRRCCRRHRRLRSSRLRSFKLAPPRRSCPGAGSRGENGGTRARFTACCFE